MSAQVAGCFWCDESTTEYHPTCDRPDCDAKTHGFGPKGTRTRSYCDDCRSPKAVTDGGQDVGAESFSQRVAGLVQEMREDGVEHDHEVVLAAARTIGAINAATEAGADDHMVAGAVMGVALDGARQVGIPEDEMVEQVRARYEDRAPDVPGVTDGGE